MRVLVCTKNAWNDMNAVGNTVSNFFGAQDEMEFSALYSRSEMPANRVCGDYFRITEIQMVKNILTPQKIGTHFTMDVSEMNFSKSSQKNSERKFINFVKGHSLKAVYSLSEKLWKKGRWINAKLEKYITDFNPDIMFSFATEPTVLRQRMQLVKRLCGAKCVLFIADDVYSVYKKKGDNRVIGDFETCIENADLLYGASEELCKEYAEKFGREFRFLCKGCNVNDVRSDKPMSPVRLVYAGNLFYGRDGILAELVSAIEKINKTHETKLFLEIYTASPVTDEMKHKLNVEGAGAIIGAKSYDEIVEIMNGAHIALQVESFEKEETEKVRLSFSTKISDCLQSGSAVMAIGPDGISSIEYLKKVDGATVITDLSKLESTLGEIADNPQKLTDYAVRTNAFAKKNHDITAVRKRLNDDFKALLKE